MQIARVAVLVLIAGLISVPAQADYPIALKTRKHRYLTCRDGCGALYASGVAGPEKLRADETFYLVKVGEGELRDGDHVAIRTSSGYWLNCHNSQGRVTAVKDAILDPSVSDEVFQIRNGRNSEIRAGHVVMLITRAGWAIRCQDSEGVLQATDNPNATWGESDDLFKLEAVH